MSHTYMDEAVAEERFGVRSSTSVLVTADLFEDDAAVGYVFRDPDGDWWFSSADDQAEWVNGCLACVVHKHPDVVEIGVMPPSSTASRNNSGSWEIRIEPPEYWEQAADE